MNGTVGIVTITVVGLVAGTVVTITAPPLAAVVIVLGIAGVCAAASWTSTNREGNRRHRLPRLRIRRPLGPEPQQPSCRRH